MPEPVLSGQVKNSRHRNAAHAMVSVALALVFLVAMLPLNVLGDDPTVTADAGVFYKAPAVQMDTSSAHVCVVTEGGNVHCWGESVFGSTDSYLEGDAVQVALGQTFTCALLESTAVHCWGHEHEGRTAGHPGGAIQVDASFQHACALLASGGVHCWGVNWDGRAAPYLGTDAVHVETLLYHNCVLRTDGNVHCWGKNDPGQAYQNVLHGYWGGDAVQLSGGSTDACVLTSSGKVHCWGSRHGLGETVFDDGTVVEVARGWHHGCVRRAVDGLMAGVVEQMECWGGNNFGESEEKQLVMPRQLQADYHVTCALSELGVAECWGRIDEDYLPSVEVRAEACVSPDPEIVPMCTGAGAETP